MTFGCCCCIFEVHYVFPKLQAHWKTIHKTSQSSNSELLSSMGRSVNFRALNSTKLLKIFPSLFPHCSFPSYFTWKSVAINHWDWLNPSGILIKRYVFVQYLVPWCIINLIFKCFKNQLTDPGPLPKVPYAQRRPDHINLSKNTRRHVHSSAYLTLPCFHHPPVNSGEVANTGTLCTYRMEKESRLQSRSKTFHHVHFQIYVPYIL